MRVSTEKVAVIALTDVDPKKGNTPFYRSPGWCVYANTLNTPEIEILLGGINDKTPDAASIFRQGNLLHFGFEQDPTQYNEFGRGLLINAVAYIAKFTEDRPILRTPSIWAKEDVVLPPRRYFRGKEHPSKPKDEAASKKWLKEIRGKLVPNADNKLVIDEDLLALDVDANSANFFSVAIKALDSKLKAAALRALARYAPDGPGASGSKQAWEKYFEENGPYLFFSDPAGYRWHLDPLAKKRKVPTKDLRGPARATPLSNKSTGAATELGRLESLKTAAIKEFRQGDRSGPPNFVECLAGYLAAAKKYQGTEDALPFLLAALELDPPRKVRDQMVQTLIADHVESPGLEELAMLLEGYGAQMLGRKNAKNLMKQLLAHNPHASVKASLQYAKAMKLRGPGKPTAAILKEYRRVIELAPNCQAAGYAKRVIFEAENLQVGMAAPSTEGEDIDGVPFKLADYDGQVVMLDFWGFW
ncbi:MAG: hypothetical protein V3W41_13660 [Planctomycetota bacterium]